mmetsp:Transcript_115878/g.328402  ORF Transcript_115878/g.328402 Transcript_115878/m.328402 type:complete len:235 (-) Transcript_115878:39-743(-)
MGAAIACFDGAGAVLVPRTRFAPVKTTGDLLALRSDAYALTGDFRVELAPERRQVPPDIRLDGRYKFVDAMEKMVPHGVPSLVNCKKLVIDGDITFDSRVILRGNVTIKGKGTLRAGVYENTTIEFPPVPQPPPGAAAAEDAPAEVQEEAPAAPAAPAPETQADISVRMKLHGVTLEDARARSEILLLEQCARIIAEECCVPREWISHIAFVDPSATGARACHDSRVVDEGVAL